MTSTRFLPSLKLLCLLMILTYFCQRETFEIEKQFNNELIALTEWFNANLLSLNIKKLPILFSVTGKI